MCGVARATLRPRGGRGLRFRDAFLGTVAAGALSLALSSPALAGPDACTISGAIETCTGNQSAGIAIAPTPLTTLDVNNLTQAITPASGTRRDQPSALPALTITSNTGAFGITTTGDNAFGIYARSIGAVTVTSTGNITTAGTERDGIFAMGVGTGAVTVTSTGNITTTGASATGILARSAGAVTVTSTGNIATTGASAIGIIATSFGGGAVTVTSTGNIVTAGSGAAGIVALGARPDRHRDRPIVAG